MTGIDQAYHSAHYYPYASGVYDTRPGLYKLGTDLGNGMADTRIFQPDRYWKQYRANKEACRRENFDKYVCYHRQESDILGKIGLFIAEKLCQEQPQLYSTEEHGRYTIFSSTLSREHITFDPSGRLTDNCTYANLWDAMAFQVQEDIAIWQFDGERDWMSAIHLCAPNHWAPQDKIGSPFSAVHVPVAGMEKMRKRYQPMLKTLLKGGSYVRFAWGLSTDTRLNHHPVPPPGIDKQDWQGRSFDPDDPTLYVRTERQTLTGFPRLGAVLFSIRTYFEEVAKLPKKKKVHLMKAIDSMSKDSLQYKGLGDSASQVKNFLASEAK